MAAQRNFVAWLNGCSVAVGSLKDVERRARDVHASALWQEHEAPKGTTLRITSGARQAFVKSVVLNDPR